LPAFAVSDDFTNFREPLGSAASEIVPAPPPPPAGAAEVDDEAADVEVAGLPDDVELDAADAAPLLLLLLDPPQAASPTASDRAPIAITDNRCIGWVLLSDQGSRQVSWQRTRLRG
jgi:hypothetical protein